VYSSSLHIIVTTLCSFSPSPVIYQSTHHLHSDTAMIEKRPLRVSNVSGATGDYPEAMARMVRSGNVQVITGDWLSEMNIAWNAITKRDVNVGDVSGSSAGAK
jgi:hypothetical protein